ncbi:hypothetical protein CsatA_017292 [Cannabis sativa]
MTMLLTKRVAVSSLCPVCGKSAETIFHLLVQCDLAAACWEKAGVFITGAAETSFLDWCILAFKNSSKEKKDLIATVCWAIWGARNDKVWQNKMSTASFIVAFAGSYLEQWKSAQSSNLESSQTGLVAGDGVESWCAPQRNQVKVNVDASLFGVDQSYGIGMVARDDHGFFLEGVTKKFSGVVRPEIAEAISFREALSWIKNQRWNQVVVETDCLIVVQALRTSCEMRSLFGLIIKECKLLLAELRNVSFHFVKRSANVVAHAFARASTLYSGCTFSMGNIPTDLLSCLIAEFEV